MAWRMVVQPNKMYARFSEIVDDFTHVNLTKNEAVDLVIEYFGTHDVGGVDRKILAADNDSNRWSECLDVVLRVHGQSAIDSLLEDISNESVIDR